MPKLIMDPAPGERLVRFVGDRLRFSLRAVGDATHAPAGKAFLRTNLGRAALLRREIIDHVGKSRPVAGSHWHDIPMTWRGEAWELDLVLVEVGFFQAKAYVVDDQGWQVWPDGGDFGVNVQPDAFRTANTIYCAFTRMFGPTRTAERTIDAQADAELKTWDGRGYTLIPPSGRLRDLIPLLPHIVDTLGCRVLHLLPVHPTPTTYARFGRFGSPYAALDLTAIDPALVEFDGRTTAVEQFQELARAVHARGGFLFLDIVINHTGWGSVLQNEHPEWFMRQADGTFVRPGAWGITWEDLVELDPSHRELWEHLAEALLTWCRRGVDGFRCDAGYKVPMPVWQYVIARVREEFPNTVFLLEGLGGAWWDTERLLTDGGMQWAYSELFQEFSGPQVAGYLDHALRQSQRVGVLAHYSETHDNERLAKRGRAWSLLRNRLSALASVNGAFGFTCGVEWLADEKVLVHGSRALRWGAKPDLVTELGQLNRLLAAHPCFFDGAKLTRLSAPDSQVYALLRESAEGKDAVLVLVNTDSEQPRELRLAPASLERDPHGLLSDLGSNRGVDLLGQSVPTFQARAPREFTVTLPPAAGFCLASVQSPRGLAGDEYRRTRAICAWALECLSRVVLPEGIGAYDWLELARWVEGDPVRFLRALSQSDPDAFGGDLLRALRTAAEGNAYASVQVWQADEVRRVTLVPQGHWLLVRDAHPFRATFAKGTNHTACRRQSIPMAGSHWALLEPRAPDLWRDPAADAMALDIDLTVERFGAAEARTSAKLRFLPARICLPPVSTRPSPNDLVLLTNGLGGMARLRVDFAKVRSKYDCALGANLHAAAPVDRHVLVKRVRVWAAADGFISPLNYDNLVAFTAGPPATWRFLANAGDGRAIEVIVTAAMASGENRIDFGFRRGASFSLPAKGVLPRPGLRSAGELRLSLTVRVDIEDRNFHWETKRNPGAEHHFLTHSRPLDQRPGFRFTPANDRRLEVFVSRGHYHHQSEWSENLTHSVEASRGQVGSGDAFSPGWFDLPLDSDLEVQLTAVACGADATLNAADAGTGVADAKDSREEETAADVQRLRRALSQFIVRRGPGKTVVAGYPWFLDWGRDTLICARGMISGGMADDVRQILRTFGRFERNGTLPNSLHGEDASNRDTSDAPLWFGVVCEELASQQAGGAASPEFSASLASQAPYSDRVEAGGRTVAEVLRDIASGYLRGTPNGIRVDEESGLVWSPRHFTWMDTNYPAGTPREGYPIEIQALWLRLLRQLDRLGMPSERATWREIADRVERSLMQRYWLPTEGYFADSLTAGSGQSAAAARPDSLLRSNGLFVVSLGLVQGEPARRCVEAAARHLVVPGALRSLAPLPAATPMPIHGNDGRLLNDPAHPYWGRYEGDEDTRRKPAYHNGTAWVWTFPTFCEALARAWDFSPPAVAAAKSYLGSMERLLTEGCLGQLPEIIDGDAPHEQRGCDAQAWSISEMLRVWTLLESFR